MAININDEKFLEVYATHITQPQEGVYRYRILAVERISNNYITIKYECKIKYHNAEDAFLNFMEHCDESSYGYIVDFFYKNENSLIVCELKTEITTKIFHKRFYLSSTNLKSISNYIASLEIDWGKIKYPHAEVFDDRVCRITL